MSIRKVTPATKKRISGRQFNQCKNKPGANIIGIENYLCPLWQKPISDSARGNFDESGYEIDHVIEHSITQDDKDENLQALCKMCHSVKTKRFLSKTKKQEGKFKVYSGWNLFSSDYRKKLRDNKSELSNEEKTKAVSQAWKKLTDSDKKQWEDKAKQKTISERESKQQDIIKIEKPDAKDKAYQKTKSEGDSIQQENIKIKKPETKIPIQVANQDSAFLLRTGMGPPYKIYEKYIWFKCPEDFANFRGNIVLTIKKLLTLPSESDIQYMISHAIFSRHQVSPPSNTIIDVTPSYITTDSIICTPKNESIRVTFPTIPVEDPYIKVFGIECRKPSNLPFVVPDFVFEQPWIIEYTVEKSML